LEKFGFERLIADRGYAAAEFVEYLLAQGIEVVNTTYRYCRFPAASVRISKMRE
jgi:hypothetical protein